MYSSPPADARIYIHWLLFFLFIYFAASDVCSSDPSWGLVEWEFGLCIVSWFLLVLKCLFLTCDMFKMELFLLSGSTAQNQRQEMESGSRLQGQELLLKTGVSCKLFTSLLAWVFIKSCFLDGSRCGQHSQWISSSHNRVQHFNAGLLVWLGAVGNDRGHLIRT